MSKLKNGSIDLFKSLFKKYDLKIFGGDVEINDSISLYNIEIDTEQFPLRFERVLNYFKIKQLGPILNLNYSRLSLFPNLGNRTLGEVYLVLDKILEGFGFEKMPESTKTEKVVRRVYKGKGNYYKAEIEHLTFIDALEAELEKIPPGLMRMFYSALIDGLTLKAISKKYNLTTERIRQKINGTIKKLAVKLNPYKGSLDQDLLETFIQCPKLIGSDYFANQKIDALFLTRLVAQMYSDLPFEENRLNLKNKAIFLRHESSIKAISSILIRVKSVKTGEFVNQLYRLLPDNFMQSLTVLLSWDRVLITVGEYRPFLSLSPKNLEEILTQIFTFSDQPLSLDQISRKIDSYDYIKESIKIKIENSRNFYKIEKDLFGTEKHLPLSSTEIQSILKTTSMMLQKNRRIVHISKLFINLKASFPKLRSKYLLHSILKNSGIFSTHRGMSFSLHSDINRRRQRKDIVIKLLNSRGVPLHKSVIITEIKKVRDFHENGFEGVMEKVPDHKQYFSDYYGLSSLHASNLDFLSGCEFYIRKIMEAQLCPYTTETDIQIFFKEYNLNKVFSTLHGSDNFISLEDAENRISFFVNKKWSYSSIVKTILFHQEKGTLSDSLLLDNLQKVGIPAIKSTIKLPPHYISHSQRGKKFILLTPDLVKNKESFVDHYIHFLTKTGNIHSFDEATHYLNNKLNLSLSIFQTEAIFRLWIRPTIRKKMLNYEFNLR